MRKSEGVSADEAKEGNKGEAFASVLASSSTGSELTRDGAGASSLVRTQPRANTAAVVPTAAAQRR